MTSASSRPSRTLLQPGTTSPHLRTLGMSRLLVYVTPLGWGRDRQRAFSGGPRTEHCMFLTKDTGAIILGDRVIMMSYRGSCGDRGSRQRGDNSRVCGP